MAQEIIGREPEIKEKNDVNFIQIFGVIKILPYICIQKNLNVNQMVKHLYIIAGCNGAGKTTASNED